MSIPTSLVDRPLSLQWYGAQSESEPLLLIHGWGMNGAVWQDLAPKLAEQGFRVGCLDLPGFGESPLAGDGSDFELMARTVADAIADLPRVHLLGWSLGGLVAMRLAMILPDNVASLVTLASSPKFQAEDDWPGIKPEVLAQFADQLQQDLPRTLDRFFALQAMGSASARDDVRVLRQAVAAKPQPEPDALAGGLDMLAQVDLREYMAFIKAPWLRIYGAKDGLVPAKGVGLIDELLQQAGVETPTERVAVLPKASHAPFISHPTETTTLLKEFYLSL